MKKDALRESLFGDCYYAGGQIKDDAWNKVSRFET